jgi:hypothetical protein
MLNETFLRFSLIYFLSTSSLIIEGYLIMHIQWLSFYHHRFENKLRPFWTHDALRFGFKVSTKSQHLYFSIQDLGQWKKLHMMCIDFVFVNNYNYVTWVFIIPVKPFTCLHIYVIFLFYEWHESCLVNVIIFDVNTIGCDGMEGVKFICTSNNS